MLHSIVAVFDGWYFLQYCLQRAKIAQIAQLNQPFQFLHLVYIYGHRFYEFNRILLRKTVNKDVSKDLPIVWTYNPGQTSLRHDAIFVISIYTLCDLGDLSNLIGSLSRTIQQYSPPSEWIMCELGFFPHFLRERSFKSWQNPRVDFFSGKKRPRRIQNGVFPFTVVEFCGRWINVYNSRLFA